MHDAVHRPDDRFDDERHRRPEPRIAVCASRGLRELRHLAHFLDLDDVVEPDSSDARDGTPVAALVWGRKRSGERTLAYAREHDIPVWHLEDGWIRSCSLDAHSRTCYSLLIDEVGVYYDAEQPSGIERFLGDDAAVSQACTPPVLDEAQALRERLIAERTTKYNAYRRTPVGEPIPDSPFVLVVDQTLDDASVRFGGMDAAAFERMLDAAVDENGTQRVVVRTHPDVVIGRRSGYLADIARERGVRVVGGVDCPLDWALAADRVYVGTSQLGYEALLGGTPVSVFGMPFYAGWGLSDDRLSHPALARRGKRRSIDELFHAAHIRQVRYRSPVDGADWTLSECLDHVALQRRWFSRNAQRFHGVAIAPWKRRYVAQYLRSPDGSISFGSRPDSRADVIVTWSFRHAAERGAQLAGDGQRGTPVWRLEDGFLRSAGLGSDYTAPGSLVIDSSGLYFDPHSPSDLETLLNVHDCTPSELLRAARLRRRILESGVSKYNTGDEDQPPDTPAAKRTVLVVGQVEDDESVKRGCSSVSTNAELLQAARKARPDAWIVYRPHPDVVSGNRRGAVDQACLSACADAVATGGTIGRCIDACDELHTMTSLTGFEALLRGRHVVTWGAPFYAGWGLTEDRMTIERRTRRRDLDELVYLALIAYPRYVDIDSGDFVDVETMIDIIERHKRQARTVSGGFARQLGRMGNIVKGMTYAP